MQFIYIHVIFITLILCKNCILKYIFFITYIYIWISFTNHTDYQYFISSPVCTKYIAQVKLYLHPLKINVRI